MAELTISCSVTALPLNDMFEYDSMGMLFRYMDLKKSTTYFTVQIPSAFLMLSPTTSLHRGVSINNIQAKLNYLHLWMSHIYIYDVL